MNILYIAYSCDPYNGSEDKIGWNVPIESAKTNHVYVITKAEHKRTIEDYLSEYNVNNIEFYYVDIPKFYKKIFKGFLYSGRLNIWHKRVFPIAKKICQDKQVDVIHQITPVEFRAIGNYGKIDNIKFICGPIGGGEFLPVALKEYTKGYCTIEVIRTVVNYWYRFKLKTTKKLDQCDFLMFANRETYEFMTEKIDLNCMYEFSTEVGLRNDELSEDISNNSQNIEVEYSNKTLVFLVAGRMIYRKGHALLLDALERIPHDLEYQCRIVGCGLEFKQLKKRCDENKLLSRHVVFTGLIPYVEMEREYKRADVLVMPSLRETTGTVLVEAMSKGLPVVTINKFGGAILLDNNTGWLYDGADKESYIENLKNAIIQCVCEREEVKRRGDNARKKAEQYAWGKKYQFYETVYEKLISDSSKIPLLEKRDAKQKL